MTKAVVKITLSPSRDIPFDRLALSPANVRHVRSALSVEELAEDIARRGLLQSLSVRPVWRKMAKRRPRSRFWRVVGASRH